MSKDIRIGKGFSIYQPCPEYQQRHCAQSKCSNSQHVLPLQHSVKVFFATERKKIQNEVDYITNPINTYHKHQ